MKRYLCAAAAVLAGAANATAALTASEAARLAAAARVVDEIRTSVPQQYWDRARCIAVIPDLKKAAFIFGGEYGKGVLSCRSGDRWSAPVFLQLAKGSWGFQAGAEQVDVVLLVMNESGVQKLLQNKVNLGAEASVAAGPIGRQGQIGTDAAFKAEILSYSQAQGLFAGIDVSGGVLRPDEDANNNAYGPGAAPRTILATRELSAPTQAHAFLTALASLSPGAATPTPGATARPPAQPAKEAAPAPAAAAPAEAAGDADLRARLADVQQTVDRLLSASSRSAGATATTGGATDTAETVTVDRATLVRLRQQIDGLMAALDRRR